MLIRKANPEDFTQMLPIFRQVIEGGDTYDFEETATDQDAFDYWFGKGVSSFVMEEDGQALGFYKIIPNHRGRGNHVANASFMVSSKAWGKGVGRMKWALRPSSSTMSSPQIPPPCTYGRALGSENSAGSPAPSTTRP